VRPGIQVFLYPEELEHVDAAALAVQVRELGCDAVSVAVAYHPARRVFPRHRRISVLPGASLYITPRRDRYGELVPAATATPALQHALLRFREACAQEGVRFRAWIVGLHQDRLAAAHPDAAARLLDGSPTGHSLCPSSPEAVEYVAALAADVAAPLEPEAIDLEGGLYPAWEPAYTLTLSLTPLSEPARLYGAQCFCDACRMLLGDDAERLERRALAAAGAPFSAGTASGEVHRLLAGELGRARSAGVSQLVSAIAAAVHGEGSLLRVFGSGPPQQAALQGFSAQSVEAADAVLLGCGPLAGDELSLRFAGLHGLVGGRSATVSTNWGPERTPSALVADVERLAAEGADGLALYNLSLVPEEGLHTFRAAARAFAAAVGARR
jgi:hypothetical protein